MKNSGANRMHGSQNELRAAISRSYRSLIFVFVFSLLVNLLMLTGPLFMLQVYDRVLASGSEATLLALFVLIVGLFAMMALLDYARGMLLARVGARFEEALEERVIRAVLLRAVLPSERSKVGNALNEINAIPSTLASPGFMALLDLPWAPFFFAALFIFHPDMGWLGVAGGVALLAITLANQLTTRRKIRENKESQTAARNFADQSRQSAEIIRAQGMSTAVVEHWGALRYEAAVSNIKYSDVAGFFQSFTKSFRMLLQSTMLALGAWLVLQGELTPGAMIAGSIILGRALAPIEQSLGQWRTLQGALSSWKTLSRLLDNTPVEVSQTELPEPSAQLSIRNLAVGAPNSDRPIVAEVNLDVGPGQAVGIIGRSGAGKSSLARVLVGLWRPAGGEIRLNGARLDQYDPEVLGGYIGYLPQSLTFFTGSITQNIAHMEQEPDEAAVVKAAKAAMAHDMILALPGGYDTIIEGGEVELSGGQRQRLALARALYKEPKILVLDEPNSALDDEGSQALNLVIRSMKEAGKIVLITTHRPTAMAEVDRVMIIEGGRMVVEGPMQDVLKAMMAGVAQATAKQEPQQEALTDAG